MKVSHPFEIWIQFILSFFSLNLKLKIRWDSLIVVGSVADENELGAS
jgi:hypothetical protein